MRDQQSRIREASGNKKAVHTVELQKQNKKGTDGICSVAESSKKKLKLGMEAREVERERVKSGKMAANLNVFAMEGTNPNLHKYAKEMQLKVLADMANSSCLDQSGYKDSNRGDASSPFSPEAQVLQERPISTDFSTDSKDDS